MRGRSWRLSLHELQSLPACPPQPAQGRRLPHRLPYCMARLIASARPNRSLQEGHIAACRHRLGAEWERLWPEVQQLLRDNRLVEADRCLGCG